MTGVALLNATLGVSLYVRAINLHGAAAVSMLLCVIPVCVIPAVAGVLSWSMLGQRVDGGTGVGLVLGALARWLNSSGGQASRGPKQKSGKQGQNDPGGDGRGKDRVEPVHQPAVTG